MAYKCLKYLYIILLVYLLDYVCHQQVSLKVWNSLTLYCYLPYHPFLLIGLLDCAQYPVSCCYRIHRLVLGREVTPLTSVLIYSTEQSDGKVPVLPGLLWPRVVAAERVLPMGQLELNCVLMLNSIAWNRTVLTCKLSTHAKVEYLC